MNTIRRGLKWKEPGQDPEAEDYQAGLKSVSGLNQSNICRIFKALPHCRLLYVKESQSD